MGIPFYLQYYVERERSSKYQWLSYGLNMLSYLIYGIFFHWIPIYMRKQRTATSNKYKGYFRIVRLLETANQVKMIKLPYFRPIYIQPGLLFVYSIYLGINGVFCFIQTADLDYQIRNYIIGKRISRVAIGNLPLIYIFAIKNDFLTSITGFTHDKLIMLHKWIARTMFAMIFIHIGLCMKYWLDLGFPVMLVIPPQIFGYIAFTCFFFLNVGSLKFIRRWAFDFFLVQHRVFSFIMLLFTFFHNKPSTEGAVILAVHQLVLDRILSRVLGLIHTRMSPTKGKSRFEILDEDTILVTVPIKAFPFHERKWWTVFLPKLNTWKAGQHVYLTVGKVSLFQQHPFTISSLSESGEMVFVIRVQKGFTKKLKKKILKMQEEKENESIASDASGSSSRDSESVHSAHSDHSTHSDNSANTSSIDVETELLATNKPQRNSSNEDLEKNDDDIILKATFVGPVGAHYQPLITFDSAVFFSAGSGSSFTFPVCLDLLRDIERRNEGNDYINRNPNPSIRLVWIIRHAENVAWYKFILDELQPFCDNGMLTIDIYVTQASKPPQSKEAIAFEGDSEYHEKTSTSEDKAFEASSSKSVSIFDSLNVNFKCGRPQIGEIIQDHVNYLKDKADYKSLAVLSCGPEDFTQTIKRESHKHRWDVDAPDIYCYTESFG